MTDLHSLITDAGFSGNEAKTYLYLLEHKLQSVTELAKHTKLQRPTIYSALHNLENKGLVSKTMLGKRTVYNPIHPRRLLQIITMKQHGLEAGVNKLVSLYESDCEKPKAQILEGIEAVNSVYRDALERLKNGEEIRIFGNLESVSKKFPEVLDSFAKIIGSFVYRAKVKDLMLDNKSAREYVERVSLKVRKNYELRLANKNLVFGFNEQYILKDKIIYFSLSGSIIFVVIIENEDLVQTQRTMFDMAWDRAKDAFGK